MASSKEYLAYVMEALSHVEDVTYRAMMGEFLLYYQGTVFGGVYDDRFLVKVTKSSTEILIGAARALPYEGGKEMFLVENIEDRDLMARLVPAVATDLRKKQR